MFDLSVAMDAVDHGTMLRRLKRTLRITGKAIQWFTSYMYERPMSIYVDGQRSNPITLMFLL